MRKFLVSFLLASVAASPSLAAHGPGQQSNETKSEAARSKHQGQSTRTERNRVSTETRVRPSGQAVRVGNQPTAGVQRANPPATAQTARQKERVNATPGEPRSRTVEPRVSRSQPPSATRIPNVSRRPVVSNVPRPGTEPPLRSQARPTARPSWNSNWRNEHRYDWHDWRRHHRNRFHLHVYVDPFGWGYFRYMIGWRLWPQFYGSRYWIVDPWMYRLPPAPPGTRWVRYYNDALLVDVWTGEVIDVIHDFFW